MTKKTLYETIFDNNYVYNKPKLLQMVDSLPNNILKISPASNKVGDIYFHVAFNHPIILVKKRKTSWICLMCTSNELEEAKIPCKSRFFEGFISHVLLEISVERLKNYKFLGLYDNARHLRETYRHLKLIL